MFQAFCVTFLLRFVLHFRLVHQEPLCPDLSMIQLSTRRLLSWPWRLPKIYAMLKFVPIRKGRHQPVPCRGTCSKTTSYMIETVHQLEVLVIHVAQVSWPIWGVFYLDERKWLVRQLPIFCLESPGYQYMV